MLQGYLISFMIPFTDNVKLSQSYKGDMKVGYIERGRLIGSDFINLGRIKRWNTWIFN